MEHCRMPNQMESSSLQLEGRNDHLKAPLLFRNKRQQEDEGRLQTQDDPLGRHPPPPPYDEAHHSYDRLYHRRHPSVSSFGSTASLIANRILDRDAPFSQSRGRWKVQHVSREAARQSRPSERQRHFVPRFTKRIWDDWFYSLAYQKTVVLILILFLTYTGIVFFFAFVYLGVSWLGQKEKVNPDGSISTLPFCDMDIHDHMEALYFSLSTMTTIGYGVSDYYFGGCWTPLLLVLFQVCTAITFDAVAIGLLFQRISRGHKRGKTILFSDKAVLKRVRGVLHFMFRVGELRHHQLREASVRAFCIRHERYWRVNETVTEQTRALETTHFVTRPIKLLHEDVGPHVLMSLPQVIVHRLDEHSPLRPPQLWYDASGTGHERFLTQEEEHDTQNRFINELQETETFLRDREVEVVCIVEGTDELTGATIQARHSYTFQDLACNETFVPCVFPYQEDDERLRDLIRQSRRFSLDHVQPRIVVDFALFHDTVQVPEDNEECPYSYSTKIEAKRI